MRQNSALESSRKTIRSCHVRRAPPNRQPDRLRFVRVGSNSMLLTISTTHHPATDLGYLLHKNPARVQSFELNFGQAHVFYPEATEERCTAALLLEVDTVGLVRGRQGPAGEGGLLQQYVND